METIRRCFVLRLLLAVRISLRGKLRAVAVSHDRRANRIRRGLSLVKGHAHAPRHQVDCDRLHTLDMAHCLLHMRRAGRAGHARYNKIFRHGKIHLLWEFLVRLNRFYLHLIPVFPTCQ